MNFCLHALFVSLSFTFFFLFCSHICDAKILKWLEHLILLCVANFFFFLVFSAISSKFSVMNSNFDDITADLCFLGTPDVRLERLKSRENVRKNIGRNLAILTFLHIS